MLSWKSLSLLLTNTAGEGVGRCLGVHLPNWGAMWTQMHLTRLQETLNTLKYAHRACEIRGMGGGVRENVCVSALQLLYTRYHTGLFLHTCNELGAMLPQVCTCS